MDGVIFFSGVYGVGKSTLCDRLNAITGIPAFSAGDLISEINGEIYGRNKVVKDAKDNQDILIAAVDAKLKENPCFLLAGHFCILNKNKEVEILPEYVFAKLHLNQIILLEADVMQIAKNINKRDRREYPIHLLEQLIDCERKQAQKVAQKLMIPLTIYYMQFAHSDEDCLMNVILGGH